ncbi:hypothetical protein [Streptomyces sp. NPDC088135]|uniref:hypothetical protein n=1 Tax=Streptomyces sp. NPDC088135 TaxID=3160993 RepID=UPI00343215CA
MIAKAEGHKGQNRVRCPSGASGQAQTRTRAWMQAQAHRSPGLSVNTASTNHKWAKRNKAGSTFTFQLNLTEAT